MALTRGECVCGFAAAFAALAACTIALADEVSSVVAGATPAMFDVDSSGDAAYRVPIVTPPGAGGFAPALALVYSSGHSGGRVLGPGWSLEGLSSVHRCAAVPAVHERRGAVAFDEDDALCLDGMPLVSPDGDVWDAGADLHTYMESFARVSQDADGYRADLRNGVRNFYGGDAATLGEGDKIVSWLLRAMRDRNGNVVRIEYEGDELERHVRRITYADNEVVFDYASLPEASAFIGGVKTTDSRRLTAIRTFADGQAARVYLLGYADEEAADFVAPRLVRIRECDGDGVCLAPTGLEWRASTPEAVVHPTELNYAGEERDSGFRVGDFNGDGLSDWYKVRNAAGADTVYLNRGDMRYEASEGALSGEADETTKERYHFADFNGDGRTDVYFFHHRRDEDALFLAAADGLHFNERPGIDSGVNRRGPDRGGACVHIRCLRFADFDGDGRTDVYRIRNGTTDEIYLYRDDGFERMQGVDEAPLFRDGVGVESVRTADFNGDGRADIYYIGRRTDRLFLNLGDGAFVDFEGPDTPVNPDADGGTNEFLRVRFGDFNGDRLSDVLYAGLRDPGTVWFSHGDGEWTEEDAPAFARNNPTVKRSDVFARMKLVDWNADGRTDVYRMNDSISPAPDAIYLSDVSGVLRHHAGPQTRLDGSALTAAHLYFGDFNGDGVYDAHLLQTGGGGSKSRSLFRVRGGDTKRGPGMLLLNQRAPPAVVSIRNGLGVWHKIHYRLGRFVHTPAVRVSYPDVREPPRWLVARTETADGVGGARRSDYRYGGGLVNVRGRGRLGFAWREKSDRSAGVIERVAYRQDFPYVGAAAGRTIYRMDDGDLRTLAIEDMHYATRALRNGRTHFVHPTRQRRQSHELDGALSTVVVNEWRDWDERGNPSEIAHTVTFGDEVWTRLERRVWEYPGADWERADIVHREIVASRAGHADESYVVSLAYDEAGRVIEATQDPDASLNVTMRYEYDEYGNRIAETADGLTLAMRDGETAWERAERVTRRAYADGRFATRRVNALGHAEDREHDARTGRATLIEDVAGRRLLRRYDAWGRLVFERDPAGVETRVQHLRRLPADAPAAAAWVASVTVDGRPRKSFLYDMYGRLLQTRVVGFDGRFIVADKTYDARGLLTLETRPRYFDETAEGEHYAYDALGRVTLKEMRTADGRRGGSTLAYGADHVMEVDARGGAMTVYYNAMGRPTTIYDADGGVVHRKYDAAARLTAVTTPNGDEISTSYNRFGRVSRVDDPAAGERHYAYDAFGRLVRTSGAENKTRRMFYDALGRMTLRVEPEGEATWRYDTATNGVGMLAGETYLGHSRAYAYDAAGRLARITDQNSDAGGVGHSLTVHYDAHGRVGEVVRSAGFALKRNYNRHGYLESMSGPPLIAFGLHETDRAAVLSVRHYRMRAEFYREMASSMPHKAAKFRAAAVALEGAADKLVAHFGETRASDGEWFLGGAYFRAAGRHLSRASEHLAEMPYACTMKCAGAILAEQQVSIARAYMDAAERHAPAQGWSPQLTPDDEVLYWRVLARDARGRVTRSRTGNGVATGYDYVDGADEVARVAHALGENTFSDTRYRYDAAGNLTARESPVDGLSEAYAYDGVDRLISVDITDGRTGAHVSRTLEYGDAGRPMRRSGVGAYTYDAQHPYALRTTGRGDDYQYDALGRLVGGDDLSVRWQSFDKPGRVARGAQWSSFQYDAGHRRIAQRKSDGASVSYFGRLYERIRRADGGLEHRHYVHADNHLVLMVRDLEDAGTLRRSLRYLHYDAQGSVDSVTDGVGRLVERMEYDTLGARARRDESSMPLLVRRGYTGHEHLDELGLIHMNGRLYDTRTGRFLSPDPFVPSWLSTQGYDRYGYAFNNPFKFGDPSGFFIKKIFRSLKRVVKSVVRAVTRRPQIILAVAAGYYAGALAAQFSVNSALSGLTFSPAAMANGSYMAAVNGAFQTAAVVGGAVGGAVANVVAGGGVREAVVGAVSGGVLGSLSLRAWSVERVLTTSAVNGLAAEVNGGEFGRAALASLGGSALKYTAWTMRRQMIAQSMLNADNASGISEGFGGDRFKLGGGRYNPAGGGPSPLGGHQGGAGAMFGVPYQPGSWQDRIVEAYAGPHDYLNSGYWYAADGNIRVGMSAFERGVGEALNWANVVVATPIVAASVAPDYIYSLGGAR